MTSTKLSQIENKKIIKSVIDILDTYNQVYKKLSKNKEKTYLEYFAEIHADEETLIRPTLFSDFLEKALGFSKNDFIPESSDIASGKRPDFIPTDTNLHPFVFDTKGTDTTDLRKHYKQIKEYIESNNLDYGILCNMRDLAVFSSKDKEPIQNYSFNFYQLYSDYQKYKMTPDHILVKPNTKKFLDFVEKFHFQKIDKNLKIKLISEKKQWTGKEILETDILISKIRNVVSWFHEDVRKQENVIPQLVGGNNRKQQIIQEIDSILEEIGKKEKDIINQQLNEIIKDKSDSLVQAKDIYFYRTAYFAMTRILLVRAWEDIKFIDESLYNGGFKKWYDNFNKEIRKILRYAFGLAADKYSWLYASENNYSWYEPTEDVLIDVLYEFSQFNFGKLNTDVLGYVYEEYVDRTDRKNKGQYYTPREIISFIWNRVGFTNDKAFFRMEGNKRQPRLIFDPATGSGGFLVEAARRIREEAKYDDKDFNELLEISNSITDGLYGSEISAFPYYITEINLLLQLTPIIKKLLDSHKHLYKPPPYCLSVIRQDSMKLQMEQRILPMTDTNILKDVRYEHDSKYDHIALEGAKREKFNFIRDNSDFDYACANPPYIREDDHKELFRQTIKYHPFWKKYYQGKMDYLFWFIILGTLKLKEGGKLGFITTHYWRTAEGATILRKFILENTLVKEIIAFGDTKIFEDAPGQFNMVFVLEKCSDEKKRKNNFIKVVNVKKELPEKTVKEKLSKLTAHITKYIVKNKYNDEYIEVFTAPMSQGELTEKPWAIFPGDISLSIIKKIENVGNPLNEVCNSFQGLVSGADIVSNENIKLLSQVNIDKFNIKIGDGIFYLTEEEIKKLNLSEKEKELLKPLYKASDVESYLPADKTPEPEQFVIYTTKDTQIKDFPNIEKYLLKLKAILDERLIRYEEDYPWFKLHRERNQKIFEEEKILSSKWPKDREFGYSKSDYYADANVYISLRKPTTKESLKYILSILNSSLINFWFKQKVSPRGDKFFLPKNILEQISIRRIDFKNPKEVKIHDELVQKVDEIIEAKKELAKFNKYFPKRLTRLADNEPLPEIDLKKFLDELLDSEKLSLRLHPQLKIIPEQDLLKSFSENEFYLARIKEEKNKLILFAKNKISLAISGESSLIKLISELLTDYIGKPFPEIKNSILLPENISTFNNNLEKTLHEIKNLHNEIKNTQKEIDNIVYDLYDSKPKEKQIIEKTIFGKGLHLRI